MLHLFLKILAHEVFVSRNSGKQKQPKAKINKNSRKFYLSVESLLQS